jgi:hypothetical protein
MRQFKQHIFDLMVDAGVLIVIVILPIAGLILGFLVDPWWFMLCIPIIAILS